METFHDYQLHPIVEHFESAYQDHDEVDEEEEDSEYEEEEEEDYDEEAFLSKLNMNNMSPGLLSALSLGNNVPKVETTWTPPSRSGLENSNPLVSTQNPPVSENQYWNSQLTSQQGGPYNSPFLGDKSGIIESNYDDESDDDDESDGNDDDDDYNVDEIDFSARFQNLSPNLMASLGLTGSSEKNEKKFETDWKPPSRPGLDNSEPLINHSNNINPNINYTQTQESDEESEYDESDDDDDEIPDFSNFGNHFKTVLSPNLMQSLGLNPSQIEKVESDWKPPSAPGLNNSQPIIKKDSRAQDGEDEKPDLTHFGGHFKSVLTPNILESLGLNASQDHNSSEESETETEEEDSAYEDNNGDKFISSLSLTQLSPSLISALGLENTITENRAPTTNTTPWVPPETPGLGNSSPLIQRSTQVEVEVEHQVEDEDEVEEEEDWDFPDSIEDISTVISPSLMKLLGYSEVSLPIKSELSATGDYSWAPPTQHGLGNSKPVLAGKTLRRSLVGFNPVQEGFSYVEGGLSGEGEVEGGSEESSEEDSDEEFSEYEEDDNIMGHLKVQTMSPNLMKLLGLEVPTELQEELKTENIWKPPEVSGLGNSNPIRT